MPIVNLNPTAIISLSKAEESKPEPKEHVYPGTSAVTLEADKITLEKLLQQEGQTTAKICNKVFWADWQDAAGDAHQLNIKLESLEQFCDIKAQ